MYKPHTPPFKQHVFWHSSHNLDRFVWDTTGVNRVNDEFKPLIVFVPIGRYKKERGSVVAMFHSML